MTNMIAAPNFWKSRTAVGVWLLAVALVILGMITIGGLTRLTGSGLSITEWKPIMGALPPLSDAAWQDAFTKYQQIPQYRLENHGMSLEAFKGIFWWEWGHRLLGRLLGVVFFVPFVWFAFIGAIKRSEWPRMLLLFALGGLQGEKPEAGDRRRTPPAVPASRSFRTLRLFTSHEISSRWVSLVADTVLVVF